MLVKRPYFVSETSYLVFTTSSLHAVVSPLELTKLESQDVLRVVMEVSWAVIPCFSMRHVCAIPPCVNPS